MDVEARHDRFCPACGHNLRGGVVSGWVRCPECGKAHRFERLLAKPPPGVLGATLVALTPTRNAVVGIVTLVVIVAVFVLPATSRCGCGPVPPPMRALRSIGSAIDAYQVTHGVLPARAEVLLGEWIDPSVLTDRRLGDQSRSVAASAAGRRNGIYDRVGDVWFANWPPSAPVWDTPDPSVVLLAWMAPDDDGDRYALFVDGHVEWLSRAEWRAVWRGHMDVFVSIGEPLPTTGMQTRR